MAEWAQLDKSNVKMENINEVMRYVHSNPVR
jgi:hypothetical protein